MYRRKVTAATTRRWKKEARGEGAHEGYRPGVQVRRTDNPGFGRSSIENNFELGRQHDLTSKFQAFVTMTLRPVPIVHDVLESHPFPTEPAMHPAQRWANNPLPGCTGSLAVATKLGLKHPYYKEIGEPRSCLTDVLVALELGEGDPRPVAILLDHRSKEARARSPESRPSKLIRACWRELDVEVITFCRSLQHETIHQNHIWVSESELVPPDERPTPESITAFVDCALDADWLAPAFEELDAIGRRLRIPRTVATALYKHCLWFNLLSTDLTHPLWRATHRHPKPERAPQPLPTWHPLATSRWLA